MYILVIELAEIDDRCLIM